VNDVKVICPECDEIHEKTQQNECECCGEKSPEIGVHRPVLCKHCTEALGKVRERIWACPNCGEKGSPMGSCMNQNCRVEDFRLLEKEATHDMILEERGFPDFSQKSEGDK